MNTHVKIPPEYAPAYHESGPGLHEGRSGPTTQAAEGMPRRAFTVDDVKAMIEAGILGPKERLELWGGEIVAMAAKGYRHEILKSRLTRHMTKAIPFEQELVTETSYYLANTWMLEPDLLVYPRGALKGLDGGQALLVVEIADSSLVHDIRRKAPVYASFGVREYWVSNATRYTITRHLGPTPEGYATITEHDENETLVPHLAPTLAVSLAALDLKDPE